MRISHFAVAEDGQLVFLHPFNVRLLVREFGSVARFPDRLTGKVLELEELVQTEVLFRYIQFVIG